MAISFKQTRWAQSRFRFALALLLSTAVFSSAFYYSCLSQTSLSLTLDVQSELKHSSKGQVFWDTGAGYTEANSDLFDVYAGRHWYRLSIPMDSRSLRIDPIMEPGSIDFYEIKISTFGWALRNWDISSDFKDWKPGNDLSEFGVRQNSLRMRSTGDDPYFHMKDLPDLRQAHHAVSLWLSIILGSVIAFIQSALFWWIAPYQQPVARAGTSVRQPVAPSSRRHAVIEVRALVLLMLASALSVGLCYLAYERLIRPRTKLERPIHNIDYELTFVDQQGLPLSNVPGDLKMVLDPFTLYRNYPGQKTARFTINGEGYRESTAGRMELPVSVMLGGSAVFGVGLDSDKETLPSLLNSMATGYRFINAGTVGFLSGQELAEMVHYADRHNPTLYIALDGWNEEYVQLFTNLHALEFGFNWTVLEELEGRLHGFLENRAPEVLHDITAKAAPQLDAVARQNRIYETYTNNLQKMYDFASARGARFLVAFQPQLGNKIKRTPSEQKAWSVWREAYPVTHANFVDQYNALVEKARSYCRLRQIAYLDLNASPHLRGPSEQLFLDTVHLNENGNRMVAKMLAARIAELQSLPTGGRSKTSILEEMRQ